MAVDDIKPLQPSWPVRPLKRDERSRRQPEHDSREPPPGNRSQPDDEGSDNTARDHVDEYA